MLNGAPGRRHLSVGQSNMLVPVSHSLGYLKPNSRPWLIEEGMTYISQGGKAFA